MIETLRERRADAANREASFRPGALAMRYGLGMGEAGYRAKGLSPFLSERARERAPQILSFAAVTGAAILVSPGGEVVLSSGSVDELDTESVARIARDRGGADVLTSFRCGSTCVHAAPICTGWMLCILSTTGVYPGLVVERLLRASSVLALALLDGPMSGSVS